MNRSTPSPAQSRRPRPASRGGGLGIPLGRVFGVPVRLSPTWLILAFLVTLWYGQVIGGGGVYLPQAVAYTVSFSFVLCLVGSVLLHELGHALTCRRYGIGVRGITLDMLGGYTEMEHEAPTPAVELAVSLAGPAVSFAVSLLTGAFASVLPAGTLARQLAVALAVGNLIVAIFNVLPGLPLDGGRAVQAAVWAATGDPHRARLFAGWAGRVVAVSSVVAMLVLYANKMASIVGVVIGLLVGFSIWTGASQAVQAGRIAGRLGRLDLARVTRPIVAVPGATPLEQVWPLFGQAGAAGAPAVAVADPLGRVLALLHEPAAMAVPSHRRAWITVETLARRVDAGHVLPAGLRGIELLRAVQADPTGDYLVVQDEDVVGAVRGADLIQLIESGGIVSGRTPR